MAEFVHSMTAPASAVRPLSAREYSLLEQSREDFKAGRTVTMDEFMASTDAMFARYRAAKPPT